jgi:tryptophanyl-tRNA synthetase
LILQASDQASHVELAREIVRSFNAAFGAIFREPVGMIPEAGLLPGTDGDPKMGRSRRNTINLFDDPEVVDSKVMAMFTDPGGSRRPTRVASKAIRSSYFTTPSTPTSTRSPS